VEVLVIINVFICLFLPKIGLKLTEKLKLLSNVAQPCLLGLVGELVKFLLMYLQALRQLWSYSHKNLNVVDMFTQCAITALQVVTITKFSRVCIAICREQNTLSAPSYSTNAQAYVTEIITITLRNAFYIFMCYVLFYGLEACSLRKYQYKSINYVVNSTLRKCQYQITRDC